MNRLKKYFSAFGMAVISVMTGSSVGVFAQDAASVLPATGDTATPLLPLIIIAAAAVVAVAVILVLRFRKK